MLHLALFLHIPSIRKGAKEAFLSGATHECGLTSSDWQISPLKIEKYFRQKIEYQYNEKVESSIFIYNDLGYISNENIHDVRKNVHDAWGHEAEDEGVPVSFYTGGKRGKGLEVKMALDFADLAWEPSSDETLENPTDKYIAVMFAMDREVAPGVERIIEHYGGHGIKVWVAMWSSGKDDYRELLSEDKDISLGMYQRIFLDETAWLEMRDGRNYSRSYNGVRPQKNEQRNVQRQSMAQAWQKLNEEEKELVHQAQKAIASAKPNEEGWVPPSRLGGALRKQFPNHPAVKIRKALTKWFERENMGHFFEVKRRNQHEIFIRVRR